MPRPINGIVPPVQFTDLSIGVITEWRWDFDNNGTVDSNEQNPQYSYPCWNGTFDVALTVIGPGGSHKVVKEDYIGVYGCG
jgi:PKD repeat protein